MTLSFRPSAAGATSAGLEVSASSGGTVTAALDGEGVAPGALSIASSAGDLGAVVVGGTATTVATFTVTNTGGSDTGPLSVQATGSDPADCTKSADLCQDEMLAPGATCTFEVAFTPKSRGPKSAAFAVRADPGGRVSGAVNGIGLAPAHLVALPATQSFGSVVVDSASTPVVITEHDSGAITTALSGIDPTQFQLIIPSGDLFDAASLAPGASRPNSTCSSTTPTPMAERSRSPASHSP